MSSARTVSALNYGAISKAPRLLRFLQGGIPSPLAKRVVDNKTQRQFGYLGSECHAYSHMCVHCGCSVGLCMLNICVTHGLCTCCVSGNAPALACRCVESTVLPAKS